jgi:hypothetical protein
MKSQELAKQEVLELELDYDQVIVDFEQYGQDRQELELESDNFYFMITVDVYAGRYDGYEPFEGSIEVYEVKFMPKDGDENEYELRVTSQIKEQLKYVR